MSVLTEYINRHINGIAIILAILFALPSLGYPLGGDQGTFYYIGREWLNGLLPYRDAFDQKPPGIHMIYALGINFFGEKQWSIRILEIFALLAISRIISMAVTREGPSCNGETGIITIITLGWYFTCLNYWDTAQVEIWEGLALLCSYLVAKTGKNILRSALISGILSGVAIIFKFPATVIALVPAAIIGWRSCKIADYDKTKRFLMSILGLGLFSAGIVIVISITVLYFIINGAFNDLIDSLIIFNYDYVTHLHTDFNLSKWWCYSFWLKHSRIFFPSIMILWFIGIRKSSKHKSKPVTMGAVSALSMALFSVLSVSIQRKYYAYHWIVAMPFFVLCAGYGVAELMPRRRNLLFIGVSAIVLSAFLFAPSWKLDQQGTYKTYTYSFWNYFLGNYSREEFLKPFQNPFGSCYSDQEKIGKMIKQLAKPGDRMSVRSYDTPIYAVSGLRSPTKYFWDLPHLWDTSFSWYAKHFDERDIENRSVFPRFVVVQEYSERDMSNLLEQGYLIIGYFPPSVIFEK